MKKIKEEIKGGEVSEGLFGGCFIDLPKPGERYAKTKHTTYECEMSIPYTVTMEEVIEPAQDANGNPRPGRNDEKQKFHLDVKFPFNHGRMQGEVELFVYATTLEEIPQKIKEAIGAKLAELEVRPPMRD